jgi:outer membrane receptor protein involved in Fe transport
LEGRFPDLPVGLPGRSAIEQDESSVLQQVQLVLGFNHPTGWFAQWASHWYQQSNRGYTPDRPGDDFWQHDLAVGYRFARRRAEVRLGVLNLTDTDYRLNPLNLHADLARERMLVTSLRLNL